LRPESRLNETLVLIRNAQGGDREAYERLFERYYPRIRCIVRARTGHALRRRMDTEDILQNAMVEAIRSLQDFQVHGEASFVHWMAGIVQNRIHAGLRDAGRQKRDGHREVALDHIMHCISTGSLSFEPAGNDSLPLDKVARSEQEEHVTETLHRLCESHREVILLRCYAGMSWKEVALVLGCSTPDAARLLFYRATRELKRAVEEKVRA
jgi:RNA polymerase sigma-70 factor (ECF subfamily)